jgi:hypothetical protein
MKNLEELIRELPPELQQEVCDFAQFLLAKKLRPRRRKLRMAWAGALHEFRGQFTSLELQKKALEWWGGLMFLVDTEAAHASGKAMPEPRHRPLLGGMQ